MDLVDTIVRLTSSFWDKNATKALRSRGLTRACALVAFDQKRIAGFGIGMQTGLELEIAKGIYPCHA